MLFQNKTAWSVEVVALYFSAPVLKIGVVPAYATVEMKVELPENCHGNRLSMQEMNAFLTFIAEEEQREEAPRTVFICPERPNSCRLEETGYRLRFSVSN